MPPAYRPAILLLLAASVVAAAEAPRVVNTAPVAPEILAITIHERSVAHGGSEPYVARDGDRIEPKDKQHVVWRDGELVAEAGNWELHRGGSKHGISADRSRIDRGALTSGDWLERDAAQRPQSWRISSDQDAAYATPQQPSRVSFKRKPDGRSSEGARSTVYLHLPAPLQADASYRIEIQGLNLDRSAIDYQHVTSQLRSEAVHVSHIGFRPDDPVKQGRISIWLGTGGAYDLGAQGPLRCELIDAQGQVAWSGEASLARRASQGDEVANQRNLSGTDVYVVDFSAHRQTGEYRLHVPGIGCSAAFPIQEQVWDEALRISLQGLLSHRSGIALPEELMGYERPRPMHPADGFRVYPIAATGLEGEADVVDAAFKALLASGEPLPEPLPSAWGGYMDAGDWDRNPKHVQVSALLLELYSANPDFWRDFALVLPEDERGNALPDLLDEVRWNLDFFRRLQTAEGGVRGGIESSAHPRSGEASWQESLAVAAFAPDPLTSLRFAAAAAHYARVVAPFDAADAALFRTAAERAYAWGSSAEGSAVLDRLKDKKAKSAREDLPKEQALAATQLLALSGEATWHDAIPAGFERGDAASLNALAYAYCRLPAELADAALQAKARQLVVKAADDCLGFQQGNPWGLAGPTRYLPQMGWVGYLSTPGQVSRALPRAFLVTSDERYLAGTIASCQFALGANPDNRAYTTGIGPDPVRFPLHIDAKASGQEAPVGITIYGPSDPANDYGFEKWVYQWYVSDRHASPAGKQWPMAEALWDIFVAPSINEYTVHQTIAPTAYTWGVLASRGR